VIVELSYTIAPWTFCWWQ